MKRIILMLAIAGTLSPVVPTKVDAGTIQRACLNSDRKAANRRLCRCIDQVARQTLSGSDQRMAARFFSDPALSQEIRQSDRSSHERFWKRYKEFGATAQAICS